MEILFDTKRTYNSNQYDKDRFDKDTKDIIYMVNYLTRELGLTELVVIFQNLNQQF